MEIDGIKVCKPIEQFVALLKQHDFTIVTQKVSDYHFHEVTIVMKGDFIVDLDNFQIENIKRIKPDLFVCECNWSTVKIVF